MGDFSVSIIQSMYFGGGISYTEGSRSQQKRFSCEILQGISRGPPPSYEEAVDPNGEVNHHVTSIITFSCHSIFLTFNIET